MLAVIRFNIFVDSFNMIGFSDCSWRDKARSVNADEVVLAGYEKDEWLIKWHDCNAWEKTVVKL